MRRSQQRTDKPAFSVPVVIGAAVGAAVAINLAVYAVGRLAGGTFEFTANDKTAHVDALTVAGFSAIPLAIGLAVSALITRSRPGFVRIAQVAAVVLSTATILAMTIPADFDATSTVALSVCHLALIPTAVVALREIERSQETGQAASISLAS